MIPKFATHLLQLKSHGTHHIRNVLQSTSSSSLPWSGLGSSSSSWGSSTGAGGAKFNAGSRFYAGYTGPGRVITQATSLPAADGSNGQVDDSEERNQALRSQSLKGVPVLRRRRSSITLLAAPRHAASEAHGTPSSSAIHSQAKHAFMTENEGTGGIQGSPDAGMKRARRNSTSALQHEPSPVSSESFTEHDVPAQLPDSVVPPNFNHVGKTGALDAEDPAVTQTASSMVAPSQENRSHLSESGNGTEREAQNLVGLTDSDLERYNALKLAKQSGSVPRVMQAIHDLRQSPEKHSVATYNMALLAVNSVRTKGMPIAVILELYNEMLERNLTPNFLTYSNVIRALCDRDHDIHEMLASGNFGLSTSASSPNFAKGRSDVTASEHIQLLQKEENFASAMALFNAARALRASHFGIETYNALLRSAGYRGDTEAAIRVFSHLERRSDVHPTMATYGHLISVYARAKDIDAAQDVFNEFRSAVRSSGLDWGHPEVASRRVYMQVFNRMISAYFQCAEPRGALALLEEMLGADAKEIFGPGDTPAPSTSTFTEIIAGFCDNGDLDSAVKWFERLLESQTTPSKNDPYAASKVPLRPDREAWVILSRRLVEADRLETLQGLLSSMISGAPEGQRPLQASDVAEFMAANTEYLLSDRALGNPAKSVELVRALQTLVHRLPAITNISNQRIHGYDWTLIRCLIRLGEFTEALASVRGLVSREREDISAAGQTKVADYLSHGLRRSLLEAASYFTSPSEELTGHSTIGHAVGLLDIMRDAEVIPDPRFWAAFLRTYMDARAQTPSTIDRSTWLGARDALLALRSAAAHCGSEFWVDIAPHFSPTEPLPELQVLLDDLQNLLHNSDERNPVVSSDLLPIFEAVVATQGRSLAGSRFENLGSLGEDTARLFDERHAETSTTFNRIPSATVSELAVSDSDVTTVDTLPTTVASDLESKAHSPETSPRQRRRKATSRINFKLSSLIEARRYRLNDPLNYYRIISDDAKREVYVTPSALGVVISALGRAHHLEEARDLYAVGQNMLASLEGDKEYQSRAWFTVEDAMVCAHAFASDIDAANTHRIRMIEQGGAPSAEAYAALILTVNDFTDDCSVALGLYNESIGLGVVPSVFLYNNIISKLSKARKAEEALEIFQEMKKNGLRPTSVTYGALVSACCRVGDADTAVFLFSEMAAQANFRPKAPPFNIMIQFFVHTKPDRERALHYYNLMVASNVQPTTHTYKLLMDAYGMIEPVDMNAVQLVFDQLLARSDLHVAGTHWASLITAWGCSCKDVDRALAIFDSIPTHPSTSRAPVQLPDAQTWEALINVLVTQHRFDLLGDTLNKLRQSGVHMTAYIANVVIRGYASAGQIEQARAVFESMADPPEGIAASFNHLNANPYESVPVSSDAPVYREPSTYEAMIRAEMGVGDRARALSLLHRMEARHFPLAVEARIRALVNQAMPADYIPDNMDLQGLQTGLYGLDLRRLPATPVQFSAPPVDSALYVEAV